jgi:A/G-specific adenine glycosylase
MSIVAMEQLLSPREVTQGGDAANVAADPIPVEQQMSAFCSPPDRGAAGSLLDWYDRERRDLPWRYGPGETPDPYRVWLSEIMLQQTTVKAVIPYFLEFVRRWPKVERLAKAKLDDVLAAWAGLGYYSRARNLHACAKAVVERHGGKFPASEAELRELPGIGPYTAAAVAAIAFGERTSPVDGNIERVVARLFAVRDPLPGSKPRLRALAATLTPETRAGDHAQAMMDLGARICTPKRPSCLMCPLSLGCEARALGFEATLPARKPKADRPVRYGIAFVALREDGHVLVRRRPEAGLLGGMLEVPSTTWGDDRLTGAHAMKSAPLRADWWPVAGVVSHTFTHFRLEIATYRALVAADAQLDLWADPERCQWLPRHRLERAALPSVMRKIIAHAIGDG